MRFSGFLIFPSFGIYFKLIGFPDEYRETEMIKKSRMGLKSALAIASGLVGSATIRTTEQLAKALMLRGVPEQDAVSAVVIIEDLASDRSLDRPGLPV